MSATAERTDIRRIREVTWGVTPATPALQFTRFTGESLNNSITTETSQEIRPDRSIADLINTDASAGGSIDFELSYGTYDDLIEAALMGTWTPITIVGVAGDISSVAAASDNITSTTVGKFSSVRPGSVIKLAGFAAPADNRIYRVVSKLDNQTITVTPAPTASETPAGTDASLTGSYLVNGTIERSYSLLKRFNDASPVARQLYVGQRVGGFSLDMSTGSLITGAWNFMGRSAEWIAAEISGSTDVPATVTPVMNAVTNITDISMDGVGLCATGSVGNLTFELDNQHREQKGLCRLGAVGIVAGQLNITVSGSLYFASDVEAKKFENNAEFEFSFSFTDNGGNMYIFTLFRAKYSSFDVNATGLATDVMGEGTMTALYSAENDAVIMVNRIPAP